MRNAHSRSFAASESNVWIVLDIPIRVSSVNAVIEVETSHVTPNEIQKR